jgi:DHA1 family bicyclomycin/chloramphenicol resistance-like MFS transporter
MLRRMNGPSLRLVLILAAMSAFGPLATDMYLPAFPAIAAGLPAPASAVQQTLAAFFAGMGLAQLVYGPLGDRFGRKPPLLLGLVVFTLASIGCALTRDISWLALLRFGQGLGGCAGMVLARAIVRDLSEGDGSIRLMSKLMLVMGLAPILAPQLGSLLLAVAEWRAIFWTLAAYSTVLALVCIWQLPESLPEDRRRRDSLLGVLALYARLLADRRFMGLLLSGTLPIAGMFAYIGGSPFVFMDLLGVSPGHYGLFFGANALGIMGAARLNDRLVGKVAPRRVLLVALAGMTAAAAALVLAAALGAGLWPIAALLFLYVSGIGATMPLATALAMQPMGRMAGSASALIGTFQFGLGAVAGAAVGLLHDGSAVPMAVVILCCGAGGLAARLRFARS